MSTFTTHMCKSDVDIHIASNLKQAPNQKTNNLKRKSTSATHIRKSDVNIRSAWTQNHNQEKYEPNVDIYFEHFQRTIFINQQQPYLSAIQNSNEI